jgi:hypothetical protein
LNWQSFGDCRLSRVNGFFVETGVHLVVLLLGIQCGLSPLGLIRNREASSPSLPALDFPLKLFIVIARAP